ncbi:hypothetical protein [Saccharothrix coeruleofusca]|uniref:Uncharacterized protein n=1 Tax=Saccharothrix coeruleofusca TaxID=33919 RepID=A0A918AQX5_9PSEU|nr:hypothetical protein [Saccharothrix coeruleofusca]GGP63948.1 hypothetical protein GCM10010185_40840 [Saccharothrix coeruleofusca]
MNRVVLAVVALLAAAGLAVVGTLLPLYTMGWERAGGWVGLSVTSWAVESVGLELPEELRASSRFGVPITAGAVLLAVAAALLVGRRPAPARPDPAEGEIVVYELRPVDAEPAGEPDGAAVAPAARPVAPAARPRRDGLARALAFGGAGVLVGAVWSVITVVTNTLDQGRSAGGAPSEWEAGDGVVVLAVACLVAVVGAVLAMGGGAAPASEASAELAAEFPGDDTRTPPHGFPPLGGPGDGPDSPDRA